MPTHHFWLNVLTQQLQKSNEKTEQRDPLKCDESLATAIIYNKTVAVMDLVLLDLEASTFASFDLTISILYFTYMLMERSWEVV